ncbi:PTS sugar transporter subunit IIA [Mycoplasma flocculare]|uniref:Ascorbate-specific PTS system EIIA component n=2 Tax=Mesomycoplasma flocculare TaxID=2128 RepID=A0A0A8E7P9_MESFC|nr:PTS sugar transporter subunit IIA [Mesomycoplasma flocculare]MXR39500.1 PTS sugar transporter subunit IIA [Mycoplasma sp. MF12]AJC50028.1 PTS sugar transporter subunit IIA [Mesomycoplasma flocculare ATCC 27399]MXR05909.1 PTS sugar transporter subunit IIA [Mesomycoplasma flocculare]MXR12321.1 PTS sugar transporter subunit IIA [Mesomycoplasma flocculare]MXR13536.1 PTS sugar transporter subunit IIA [Mesomycoplasma flocculare]
MELFNEKLTKFVQISNWIQAIYEGVKILVENKIATFDLEKAIIEQTKKFGAYYVLEEGVALLHAPVGNYCLKVGVSILVLDKMIVFNNQSDKKAKIIFTLSAPNADDHIYLIKEFATFFGNSSFKKEIYAANSITEFYKIIKKYKGLKNEN